MNKVLIRKPVALMMVIMMLLSSVIVYVPAYADPAPVSYDILVGEQVFNQIISDTNASHILIPQQVQALLNDGAELRGWFSRRAGIWFTIRSLEEFEEIEYDLVAKSITGTSDFDAGQYSLILLDADLIEIGTRTLNVALNTAPEAMDFTLPNLTEVEADANVVIDVTSEVEDVDTGQTLSLVGTTISDPAAGTVSTDGNLNVIYNQKADFAGSFTIDFTVQDNYFVPAQSNLASITVVVENTNDAPVAGDISKSTTENTLVSIDPLSNWSDADATDAITFVSNTDPSNGVVVPNGLNLEYTPNPGFSGTDIFEYTIKDLSDAESTGQIRVAVSDDEPDNLPPLAPQLIILVGEGQQDAVVDTTGVMDQDSPIFEIISVSNSANGNPYLSGGSIYYSHDGSNTASDSFTYIVSDGELQTEGTVLVLVVSKNGQLIAFDDSLIIVEDTVGTENVITNDLIEDGFDYLVITQDPANGSVIIDNFESIQYTPDDNFVGIDTVEYMVYDEDGDFDSAVLTIDVTSEPDIYPIEQLEFDIDKDETLTFNPLDELDVDFGPVTGASFTDPAFGVITDEADGQITFNPGNQHRNVVVFAYELLNASGDKVVGNVIIDVGLLSDEIAIYLYPFETINPYNQDVFTDFFFQQGDDIDLMQHMDYGLVGTDYPANAVNEEIVELQMVPLKGFVAPGENAVEDGVILSVQSYGQILITYNAADAQGHTGRSVSRWLTINHQPQISVDPITPSDPFNVQPTTIEEPDVSIFFYDQTFDLLDFAYLYDFEEYDNNLNLPIGETLPEVMDVNFIVDGVEYDLEELWDVLRVPHNEEPDVTSKIFEVTFKAYDSAGGVSEESGILTVEVKNNPPYFEYENIKVEDGFSVARTDDLYTTVGVVIDEQVDIVFKDIETMVYGLSLEVTDEWRVSGSGPWMDTDFDFDTAGEFELRFTATDAHGETAVITRFIEINTIPTIEVTDVPNDSELPESTLIRQVGDSVDLWDDVATEDLDQEDQSGLVLEAVVIEVFDFDTETWGPFTGPFTTDDQGRYKVMYSITDPWDESAEVTRELWINEAPMLDILDAYVLLEVDESEVTPVEAAMYDVMTGITYSDFEDDYLALADFPELETQITVIAYENSMPLVLEGIPLDQAGLYEVRYTVTDSMGGETTKYRQVMVIRSPELDIDQLESTILTGGSFPVWNDVAVTFFTLDDLTFVADGYKNVEFSLKAYLGEVAPESEIENGLVSFDQASTEGYEIHYVAVMRNLENSELIPQGEEIEPEWFYTNALETRTVFVVDELLDDAVFISDMLKYQGLDNVSIEEEESLSLDLYDIYPVLMMVDAEGNELMVTAIQLEDFNSQPNNIQNKEMMYYYNMAFDDIAVLNTLDNGQPQLFGLLYDEVYKINSDGTVEFVFDVLEEMSLAYGEEVPEQLFRFLGMTADENDHLVIPTVYAGLIQADVSVYDFEDALLYFDPDGFLVDISEEEEELSPRVIEAEFEMRYLTGLGLIDYDNEEHPWWILDIAYNEDLTKLYGLSFGVYSEVEADDAVEQFVIFSVVESDIDPKTIDLDMELPEYMTIKAFEVEHEMNLEQGYVYEGLATLEEDIFVTRFGWNLFLSPSRIYDDIYFETEILVFNEVLDEFVLQDKPDPIDGIFDAALGAASTFDKYFNLSPSQETVYVGFGQTAADGLANFTADLFPTAAYGQVTWNIVTGSTVLTNDGNGQFSAVEAEVGGSANATISVTALNKATGLEETLTANIQIIRRFAPSPTPTATPLTPITVSLDIDAITLDYGETADPEFTSYDFTETVLGTANTAVTWELDDETFASVDENGVVTARDDVPLSTGDITVELTVRTVVGNATDTATILFEEQTPLGATEFFEPYISGYSDGSFRPKNYVTRAEVASMFSAILKLNTDFPGAQKFNDVSDEHWAYSYIQAMFRAGLFTGYVDDNGVRSFNPDAPISRAEIAQVFTNYWKFLDISVTGENTTLIPDLPKNHWAAQSINRIYNTGIFTGFENGSFMPEEATLREQIVSMINRLINRPPNTPENGKFEDVNATNPNYGDIEAASQAFLNSGN